MEFTPDRARNYPSTLLEWFSAERNCRMAVRAKLPDGQLATSAIKSWTTGDEYTAHLLQSRFVFVLFSLPPDERYCHLIVIH